MIPKISIKEYLTESGSCAFRDWFDDLDSQAAAIVTVALARLADGNVSNVKPVGQGVSELKIDRGPGYRVYFGREGTALVILLGGGTKRRQDHDISRAIECWQGYKMRRSGRNTT